jgi:penicillin-binding protein-related factor A (putative recombinase)
MSEAGTITETKKKLPNIQYTESIYIQTVDKEPISTICFIIIITHKQHRYFSVDIQTLSTECSIAINQMAVCIASE